MISKENIIIQEDIIEISRKISGHHFQNKTILISGASGFLASYMLKYFLYLNELQPDQNTRVIALVRNIKKARDRFKNYINDSMLQLLSHDINNIFKTDDSIDYFIHTASQASPNFYKKDPVGTLKPNVLGTINLLDLAIKKKPQVFLYISSSEVYGDNNSKSINEDQYGVLDPTNIRSCYAESKKMGENICVSYNSQYGVKVKIIRPFHIFGPGLLLDDGRVQADLIKNLVQRTDLILNSDGSAYRSFCYIKDAIIGFLKVMLNGKLAYPYNIGNPNNGYTINELAQILVNDCADYSADIIFNQDLNKSYLKSNVSIHSPNIDRAKEVGWAPETDIRKGFLRTINSYK